MLLEFRIAVPRLHEVAGKPAQIKEKTSTRRPVAYLQMSRECLWGEQNHKEIIDHGPAYRGAETTDLKTKLQSLSCWMSWAAGRSLMFVLVSPQS